MFCCNITQSNCIPIFSLLSCLVREKTMLKGQRFTAILEITQCWPWLETYTMHSRTRQSSSSLNVSFLDPPLKEKIMYTPKKFGHYLRTAYHKQWLATYSMYFSLAKLQLYKFSTSYILQLRRKLCTKYEINIPRAALGQNLIKFDVP